MSENNRFFSFVLVRRLKRALNARCRVVALHASCRQRAPMRQMANDQLANQNARFIQVML